MKRYRVKTGDLGKRLEGYWSIVEHAEDGGVYRFLIKKVA